MEISSDHENRKQVWDLIKDAHSALLVTIGADGCLDSRPMGCLQKDFDGSLWFLTFKNSKKIDEIVKDGRVLISYAKSAAYEYVSISGTAHVIEDRTKIMELWKEGLRVWFPKGPEDPDLALLVVDVKLVKYWTDPASTVTYAWAYAKSRLTGKRPAFNEIAKIGVIRF